MKAAIVGCGVISGLHISALNEIKGVELVAVCDRDKWRAEQVAALGASTTPYVQLGEMLRNEAPDIVHVLTPPEVHAENSIEAMDMGCHVLVEKPMTLSLRDADSMIAAAKTNGVKLGTNHNYLFKPSVQKAQRYIRAGAIGKPVQVDSFYSVGRASYAGAKGRTHWAWDLPGGIFTNFLPHLIYLHQMAMGKIDSIEGLILNTDQNHGDRLSDLSVLLNAKESYGSMVVSMRSKPYSRYMEILGTRGRLHVDLVGEICTFRRDWQAPSMISRVLNNMEQSTQLAWGTVASSMKVVLGRLKRMPGLRAYIREFYECVEYDREPPVSGSDGRHMVEILEMVRGEIAARYPAVAAIHPVGDASTREPKTRAEREVTRRGLQNPVLVTGATGFLGQQLVKALWRCGGDVIALVRDPDRVPTELRPMAKFVSGDLRDSGSIEEAMRGARLVYHCAAITANNVSWREHQATNIEGSEAVFQAALAEGVERLIHVSSVAVYGVHRVGNGKALEETSSYARDPSRWAYYLRSKLESDKLAVHYGRNLGLPVVIVRLGVLYGPGGREIGHGIIQIGSFRFSVGRGGNRLPFTFVDNAVDSLLLAATAPNAVGEAYNVVDDPQARVRDAVHNAAEIRGDKVVLLPVPVPVLSVGASALELSSSVRGSSAPPKLSRYVIQSASRDLQYDTSKAKLELGWRQEVSLNQGLQATYGSNETDSDQS